MGKEEIKKEFIECECGTHLLQIIHNAEYFDDIETNKQRIRQEFWLAMFNYGNQKPSFWQRIRIIWNYLKTGKMHEDQMILTTEEAQKLAIFINNNIIETEKD
jgi:hypothetical protein